MSAWRPLVEFSIRHPRLVLALALVLTVGFAAQLPKMRADTDPKNMLPITSPVRQYNDQVEGWFGLHADVIVLGIRRDDGIFAPDPDPHPPDHGRHLEAPRGGRQGRHRLCHPG